MRVDRRRVRRGSYFIAIVLSCGSILAAACSEQTPERPARATALRSALTLSEAQALCAPYPGTNVIVGTDGDDTLDGTNKADCIVAGRGKDIIHGGNGADIIFAGDGADEVYGDNGADKIFGGPGDDKIYGGNDDDELAGEDGSDLIDGENGNDRVNGGSGHDDLRGANGDDVIYGGPGDDKLTAGNGNDELHGEDGADLMRGEAGDDRTFGEGCYDRVVASAGNDRNNGGPGIDACDGAECELLITTPVCVAGSCGANARCVLTTGICVPSSAAVCEGQAGPSGDAGTPSCVPTASVDTTCNGSDDDCNGRIDEDYVAQAVQCGQGACARTTQTSCVNGAVSSSCTPGSPAASDALCNGIDDDCNGVVDEDYTAVATHCGVGKCSSSGVTHCQSGSVADSCSPGQPAANDATCDALDDDCDGVVDENFSPMTVACGAGACAASGTQSCVAGQLVSSCTPGTASAQDTICNGIDDDCDGHVDEDFPSTTTQCGVGDCLRHGATSCIAGQVRDSCVAGIGQLSDVTCNGRDEDCDGTTDEDYVTTAISCGVGGCARTGQRQCAAGATVDVCMPGTASASDATCDAIDDDCDGRTDENYSPTTVQCGVGACSESGSTSCSAGHVVASCTPGGAAAQDTICNAIDDDCDGNVDEDFQATHSLCGIGACVSSGLTTCQAGVVLDSCTPGLPAANDATCNAVDDDCDGQIDEAYTSLPTQCGVGACAAVGSTQCSSGSVLDTCRSNTPLNSDPCNGLDDDCDGQSDEDFSSESVACGVGACRATGSTTCMEGLVVSSCAPSGPAADDGSCNGQDDDCDGRTDEGYDPVSVQCGIGVCAAMGSTTCTATGIVQTCVPGQPLSADADCNGRDDDCDGSIDESFVDQATTCGAGACVAHGVASCVQGVISDSCTPRAVEQDDTSCDAVDNDCDGKVDESFPATETSCGFEACVASGQLTCVNGVVVDTCVATPTATEDTTCDGIDDDCGGTPDEDFVPRLTWCGTGACENYGVVTCVNGAEVTDCTPNPSSGDDSNCNSRDEDCDGRVDEAFVSVESSCASGTVGHSQCLQGREFDGCSAVESDCSNGQDDDGDSQIDCSDDDCKQRLRCLAGAACSSNEQCAASDAGDRLQGACLTQAPGGYCVYESLHSVCPEGTQLFSDYYCVVPCTAQGGCSDPRLACRTLYGAQLCLPTCATGACAPGTACDPTTDLCNICQPNDELCDGQDNDCNGAIDEDYVPETVGCGIGACQRFAQTECVNGNVTFSCVPGDPTASDDPTCDAIDDDCDGNTDENFPSTPTTCGSGRCASTGSVVCQGGQQSDTCQPTQGAAWSYDPTCDGLDDDCDGRTDEEFPSTRVACQGNENEACSTYGDSVCVNGEVSVANCAAVCETECLNGIDDDSDGAKDCADLECKSHADCQPQAAQIGSRCCTAQDCSAVGPAAVCDLTAPGGYCTLACNDNGLACPSDSTCVAGTCRKRCSPGGDECATLQLFCSPQGYCYDYGCQHGGPSCGCDPATNRCTGTQTCSIGVDKTCDHIDDDQDGRFDEDFGYIPTTCGHGACLRDGFRACSFRGEVTSTCEPGTPAPDDSSCNLVDDDCDEKTDEDATDIAIQCGIGACQRSGVNRCANGQRSDICTPGAPLAATDSTCDGRDDDCSGTADEDYVSVPTGQSCGVGACRAPVMTSCVNGQLVDQCQPSTQNEEVCNGLDDDCDGTIDEGYVSLMVTCGVGSCASFGATSCVGGEVISQCSPFPPRGTDSVCNGEDEDCDGRIDEGWVPSPTLCGEGSCVATGMTTCGAGGLGDTCVPSAPVGDDTTCDGLDDDCDGLSDEAFVGTTVSCGVGACARQTQTGCELGELTHGCSTVALGVPAQDDQTCDGVDDNCNGAVDEGFVVDCDGDSQRTCVDGAIALVSCSDGNACNGAESCAAGRCVPSDTRISVDDGNPCTDDGCDASGEYHRSKAPGTSCSDGDFCNGQETCQIRATNLFANPSFEELDANGVPTHWTASNAAQTGSLRSETDPVYQGSRSIHMSTDDLMQQLATPLRAGASYLLSGYHYVSFAANGTLIVNLNGSDSRNISYSSVAFHFAGWNPFQTCFHAPDDAAVRPQIAFSINVVGTTDAVSLVEVRSCTDLRADTCVAGTPVGDDNNSCTTDVCQPNGEITHVQLAAGTSCNDGNSCTQNDVCTSQGGCWGEPNGTCAELGSQCTSDSDCAALGSSAICLTEAANKVPHGVCTIRIADTVTQCPAGSIYAGNFSDGSFIFAVEPDRDYNHGYCLPECTRDADCPDSSMTCLSDLHACIRTCGSRADCRDGTCGYADALVSLCVPATASEVCPGIDDGPGGDTDGDGLRGCADPDCAAAPGCSENCFNNIDDDGDYRIDCIDPVCEIPCEVCDDFGLDEDRDGLADCLDPDCRLSSYCVENTETRCSNQLDDNGNGQVDCREPSCAFFTFCQENVAAGTCRDLIDNDQDGKLDCADPDCAQAITCNETGNACSDSRDNDYDGLTDCADQGCKQATNCLENVLTRCFDHKDNDLDGVTDCADPDCQDNVFDCSEHDWRCNDGVDNDRDGLVDCADPNCDTAYYCGENNSWHCSDHLDNDGDGLIDCDDTNCKNIAQVCTEVGNVNCHDNRDNDHDNLVDCLDPGCDCYEWCSDGVDNDRDSMADCLDSSCYDDAACFEQCNDGIDNNLDGRIDCYDPHCDGVAGCIETNCNNGIDDEHDGRTDCADPDCSGTLQNCPELCDNGIDDNVNGLTDCHDPACADNPHCHEHDCSDKLDNDQDSLVDCSDSDCTEEPACRGVPEICGNSFDDDLDGLFDCADPDCTNYPLCSMPPPRAADVAPALDPTLPSTLYDMTRFIYEGSTPVQYFVHPGTITPARVAMIRGRVLNTAGAPLPGAVASIHLHPEYGQAISDADGFYTMVVNGGGPLTVGISLTGFLTVNRRVNPAWDDTAPVDDVVMTQLDARVTEVSLTGSQALQVARGNVTTDQSGPRQATILFPSGVEASMRLVNGGSAPLPSGGVRLTEFTVGALGPKAMVAELPPNTAYTYALELSVDEAVTAGATSVTFSQPLPLYVENIIQAPVGTAVPTGYYDRERSVWVTSKNGRVVKLLSESDGSAVLAVDTDGQPATAAQLADLGVTPEELRKVAELYEPGVTLWRVPIDHFTPWDCNWPYGPPADAEYPPENRNQGLKGRRSKGDCDESVPGSSISCLGQSLGETIPLPGTGLSLHYESNHVAAVRNTIDVAISDSDGAATALDTELVVNVASRTFREHFAPGTPAQTYKFVWDGRDAFGRALHGTQTASLSLCNKYKAQYFPVARDLDFAFAAVQGRAGNTRDLAIDGDRNDNTITLCRSWTAELYLPTNGPIGGWNIDVHHTFDPQTQSVLIGAGPTQKGRSLWLPTHSIAGNGSPWACRLGAVHDNPVRCGFDEIPTPNQAKNFSLWWPGSTAIGPDGSIYFSDQAQQPNSNSSAYIGRITPDGASSRIAGRLDAGTNTKAGNLIYLNYVSGIEFGPDGYLYIMAGRRVTQDSLGDIQSYVLRMAPDGSSYTVVAGSMTEGAPIVNADLIPATSARIGYTGGLAFGPDGSLYIAEDYRVRRVGPDGLIRTVAGKSVRKAGTNPATQPVDVYGGIDTRRVAATDYDFYFDLNDVAVNERGEVFIAGGSAGIMAVGTDGIIRQVMGGSKWLTVDPDPFRATPAPLNGYGVEVGRDNDLYFRDGPGHILKIRNGGMVEVAAPGGIGTTGEYVEGQSSHRLIWAPLGMALHPDGDIVYGDRNRYRIIKIESKGAFVVAGMVPSADGTQVWRFNAGRHDATLDSRTLQPIESFEYDANAALVGVRDRAGNLTRITRDSSGYPTAVIPPFGSPTTLQTDSLGRLTGVTLPHGGQYAFTYTRPGSLLLKTFEDANQHTSEFTYDDDGAFTQERDADGAIQTLTRSDADATYGVQTFQVAHARPGISNPTIYRDTQTPLDTAIFEVVQSDGTIIRNETDSFGTSTTTQPDGTVVTTERNPDPRWGLSHAVPTKVTTKLPSGKQRVDTETRSATFTDPLDPLTARTLTTSRTFGSKGPYLEQYDAVSRVVTLTTPMGRHSSYQIDPQGRIVSTQLPGMHRISRVRDARGRLSQLSVGDGDQTSRTWTYDYDPGTGFINSIASPSNPVEVEFERDASGRVTAIAAADGETVNLAYDAMSHLIGVTPPGRSQHKFSYTGIGAPSAYRAPALTSGGSDAVTDYGYKPSRDLDFVTTATGETIDIQYSPTTGKLTRIAATDLTLDTSYDAAGRTSALVRTDTTGTHTITNTYDGSVLLGETWSASAGNTAGAVARVLDADLRVQSHTVNGASIAAYGYDADGLLLTAGPLTITRAADSGIVTATILGNTKTQRTISPFGELLDLTATYAGNPLYKETIVARDASGRIQERTEAVGTAALRSSTYTYDIRGRLSHVESANMPVAAYTYDANGNRTSYTTPLGSVVGRYDTRDRLTRYCSENSSGAISAVSGLPCFAYTYRESGELQTKVDLVSNAATELGYDGLGQLQNVRLPNGSNITYENDARGRRIGKSVDGTKRWGLLYQDALRPIALLDANNVVVATFVYADAMTTPRLMTRGGQTYRYIVDHLGSVRMVVNAANGDIAQLIDYDEFGNVLSDTNPGFQPFGFAGGLYDPDTQLVRFGARDYDAVTGRWIQRDPILFRGGQMNLYSYVAGEPINRVDPTGLIVSILDPDAATLVEGLSATPAGDQLLQYLDASPIEYMVATTAAGGIPALDSADLGQFGQGPYEMTPCPKTAVRVNVAAEGLDFNDAVITLGHELGHAALYNNYNYPFDPLPEFLSPDMTTPDDPGGMPGDIVPGTIHGDWSLVTSPELFGSH